MRRKLKSRLMDDAQKVVTQSDGSRRLVYARIMRLGGDGKDSLAKEVPNMQILCIHMRQLPYFPCCPVHHKLVTPSSFLSYLLQLFIRAVNFCLGGLLR